MHLESQHIEVTKKNKIILSVSMDEEEDQRLNPITF